MPDARPRSALRQHHPHPVHGRRAAGQLRPPRHADGAGAGGLRALAAPPALRPRPTRSGPTATASSSRGPRLDAALLAAAPDRREGGQPEVRDARRAVGAARRHQALPPARQPVPRPPGVPLDLAASRPPPARSARAWPPASAWPSPRSGWPRTSTAPASTMFDFDVYALCGDGCMMEGISQRGRLARRPPASSTTSAGSTTTTTSPSRATPTWPSARTWPRASSATAGTSRASATPTTSTMLDRAFETFKKTHGPADAHHRRQPHRLRRAEQAGHARRPRRAARRGGDQGSPSGSTAGRRTRSSSCPTACASTSRTASARAARRLRDEWMALFDDYKAKYPGAGRRSSTACSTASCPTGWDKDLPDLPGRRQGHGRPRRLGQGAERPRPERPLADRRLGRPGAVHQDAPDVRRRGRLRGRQLRRPQLPLRHPRARHGRDPQRPVALEGPALRLGLPDLQRLRPARRSAWPRSWRSRSSTSSRTTRSASARTGRRTSRSSSSLSLRAIPGLITLRPGDANEVVGGLAGRSCSSGTSRSR